MKMYAIYDRAIAAYTGAPFFQPTNAAALRVIKQETNREGSQLATTPTDYELWQIADFDEQTGEIHPMKERLARLEDLKGQE